MRQIFWIIIIIVVVIFGAAWYIHRSKTHAINSGEVFVREQQGDKLKTDAASAPAAPAADQPAETQEPATAVTSDAQQAAPAQSSTPAQGEAMTPPATDSIPRNPPNGMVFAGTGKFQLYRQGDITWRLNTETGQACIIFATNAEWQQPRVFAHGCGGT